MNNSVRYILGLDIGVSSVGWSVLNLEKERIEDLGLRVFDAAENPKTGVSLALQRRQARSRRRLLRRKAYRVVRVKKMLVKEKILAEKELNTLYNPITGRGIWELRAKALNELVTNEEWARLLIFFVKNRGFKSNRKNEINNKELGPILKNLKSNIDKLELSNYKTFGQMLYEEYKESKDPSFSFRNKNGEFINGTPRFKVEEEIKILFESQRNLGYEFATKEIENKYLDIFNSQRPYSNFETLESFVGYCTFEKNNKIKRAPKHCISAEEFTMYTSINKLSIIADGTKRKLTEEERNIIVETAYKKELIKYSDLRKLLDLKNEEKFSTLIYTENKDFSKTESTKFISLKGYHELRKAISKKISKEYWEIVKNDKETLNNLAYVLTLAKTDDQIIENLKIRNIEDDLINSVLEIEFTKFNNLSIKAIEKILPFLKEGFKYSEACELAGYNTRYLFKGKKTKKLPVIDIEEIVSPVINRSLSQTRKVINSIIDMYGSPEEIHLIIAKDIDKNKLERNKSEKLHKEYKETIKKDRNELKLLMNNGIEPTSTETMKYILWKQQGEMCPYTQENIPFEELFKPGNYSIDYILPYSRSFNDSLDNKVLTKSIESKRKGNKTPFEYFGEDCDRWDNFTTWIETNNLPYSKKNNLRKKTFIEEEKSIKKRNITDTRYITKYIVDFIYQKLEFSPSTNKKKKVIALNKKIINYIKNKWDLNGITPAEFESATTAAVAAAINENIINDIAKYIKSYELKNIAKSENIIDIETGEIIEAKELDNIRRKPFPIIWPYFKSELMLRMNSDLIEDLENNPKDFYDIDFINNKLRPIFISRMPKRKVPGQLFEETIYPTNNIINGKAIRKKKLIDLVEEDFDNIHNYHSDKKMYDEIYRIFVENDKDSKKAFGEVQFRKPTKSGKLGPVVNSIKIVSSKLPAKDYINLKNKPGNFKRGDMARIDIYEKDDKFYVIPIYSYQILSNSIPRRAATAGKSENEWVEIDESYIFKMSVYKNDLIKISYKNNKSYFGYYNGFNRATASILIIPHNSLKDIDSVGLKRGVVAIEKYNMDILGYYTLAKR